VALACHYHQELTVTLDFLIAARRAAQPIPASRSVKPLLTFNGRKELL
jgi:hypothetical protein